MPVNDELGKRMKEYERRNQYYLQKRTPVILRCDSRAGHTLLKGFKRPFDEVFMKSMQDMAKYLCENVMNARIAYVQSDEVSLVLADYEKLDSDAFFDYRTDKLCSITASMATLAFNKALAKNTEDFYKEHTYFDENEDFVFDTEENEKLYRVYQKAIEKGAMFDCRCFNIPKEEVVNCVYWRQVDASRNSVQMVGQAYFSHKELDKKSNSDIQDMLMLQKGINWNNYPTHQKRGSCVIKKDGKWVVDLEIPIFRGEDRNYIEKLINFDN